MASSDSSGGDDSLYPIAVLIDELRNVDIQVDIKFIILQKYLNTLTTANCVIIIPIGSSQQYQKTHNNKFGSRSRKNPQRTSTFFNRSENFNIYN